MACHRLRMGERNLFLLAALRLGGVVWRYGVAVCIGQLSVWASAGVGGEDGEGRGKGTRELLFAAYALCSDMNGEWVIRI